MRNGAYTLALMRVVIYMPSDAMEVARTRRIDKSDRRPRQCLKIIMCLPVRGCNQERSDFFSDPMSSHERTTDGYKMLFYGDSDGAAEKRFEMTPHV